MKRTIRLLAYFRLFIGRNLVWFGLTLLLREELRGLGDPKEVLLLFPLSGVSPSEFQTLDPLECEKMKRRLSQHVLFRGPVQNPKAFPLEMSRPA
jgi:hypothetical protein